MSFFVTSEHINHYDEVKKKLREEYEEKHAVVQEKLDRRVGAMYEAAKDFVESYEEEHRLYHEIENLK